MVVMYIVPFVFNPLTNLECQNGYTTNNVSEGTLSLLYPPYNIVNYILCSVYSGLITVAGFQQIASSQRREQETSDDHDQLT